MIDNIVVWSVCVFVCVCVCSSVDTHTDTDGDKEEEGEDKSNKRAYFWIVSIYKSDLISFRRGLWKK